MHTDGPVMIALDGSAHSDVTLRWGMDEASLRDAPVLLVRVYRMPHKFAQWSWYPIIDEDLGFDTEAKAYLAGHLAAERARHPAMRIDTREAHGPETPELRRLSEEAQLLVLGATGRTGRARIGSVSGHLAAHARCPMAVVRAKGAAPHDPAAPVVVGVDGSPASIDAARTAAREASLRAAALVVVHARPTITNPHGRGMPALVPLGSTIDEHDPTHQAAQDVADLLHGLHPDLDVHLELVDDDPVHALVHAARGASLLVVGSRGLGAFRGMLLGAVSNEVVRTAPSTVLVMHDGETD